uniref:Uncharacterized protein n=1 Tax=Arundo donax TaxID=35708 RepID=A0A0A9HLQ8_ARUDO
MRPAGILISLHLQVILGNHVLH